MLAVGAEQAGMTLPPPAAPAPASLLEVRLFELLGPTLAQAEVVPPRSTRGRPAVLSAAMLWLGLLVGILQGVTSQRGIWRLLSVHGLWGRPPIPVGDQALYNRLQRLTSGQWQEFFALVTAALVSRLSDRTATHLAPFAPRIVAFDHTVLDPVLRKGKLFRPLSPGDLTLLPGALACAFDVRRQLWLQVLYREVVQSAWDDFAPAYCGLEPGSLLLFDLGFFCFQAFDRLTQAHYHFVTRLRGRVTYTVQHAYYTCTGPGRGERAVTVTDQLVYWGTYRANQAAEPVRLIEVTFGTVTYRYVTNVLDPRELPAWQVVALYRRRWDIESGFDLVKTHLGLATLWSSHRAVLLHQVFATFLVAQVLLGLRNEVAARASCELREVSTRLLVEWLPRLAQLGKDPLEEFARTGRRAGYIRPVRSPAWEVPEPPPGAIARASPVSSRRGKYPNRQAYLQRQKERRTAKRASGASTYRPYGHKP